MEQKAIKIWLLLLLLSACNIQQGPLETIKAPTDIQQTPVTSPAASTTIQPTPTMDIFTEIYASPRRIPVKCNQIQENALRSLEFGKMSLEDAQQWFNKSPFQEANVRGGGKRADGTQSLNWDQNGIQYHANFRNDVLASIDVEWTSLWKSISLEPTGDEILACFGLPDMYQARYIPDIHEMEFQMSLWYLDEGVIISVVRFRGDDPKPPEINGNVVMTLMTITASGDEQEALRLLYPEYKNDEYDNMLDFRQSRRIAH